MKILGIDYGMKRIGLSISDENQRLAFPKEIVRSDANTFARLGQILKNHGISEIVIGESVDFSGKPNPLQAQIETFILKLREKFKLPVQKQKEFLTSVEARRYGTEDPSPSQAHSKAKQIKGGRADAGAAALILQRYLDRKNQLNNSGNSGNII